MWYLIVSISDLCTLTYYDVIYKKNSVLAPSGLVCCPFEGGGSVVVDSLFIVTPILVVSSVFGPYFGMECLGFFLGLRSSSYFSYIPDVL